MIYFSEWLNDTTYVREMIDPPGSFHHYRKHLSFMKNREFDKVCVMMCQYSYKQGIYLDSDILGSIKTNFLDLLRNKQCVFVLDGSHEGWAVPHHAVSQALYNSAVKHNIDPAGIFFISGNLREKGIFDVYWHGLTEKKNKINVIEMMHWDSFQKAMYIDAGKSKPRHISLLENYNGKYFLNLNRRKRFWRSYAVWRLHDSGLAKHGLISHDKVRPGEYRSNYFHTDSMDKFMSKNTPMIVDTEDFETNWANDLGIKLNQQVLFNLTCETMQSDWNETSLFYSEKTFKVVAQKVPIIIWGQMGQNYNLARLGYKLYTDWFDYEFDFIRDPAKRWAALEKELKRVCKLLSKMNRTQQIDWSLGNVDVLNYNYKRADYNQYSVDEFLLLVENSIRYTNGNLQVDEHYQSKNVF